MLMLWKIMDEGSMKIVVLEIVLVVVDINGHVMFFII